MSEPNGALISLEGITKVYYTDELETHALVFSYEHRVLVERG